MTLVTLDAVNQASRVIAGKAYRTPMVRSTNLSAMVGVDLYLKRADAKDRLVQGAWRDQQSRHAHGR